jgi:hypothetical protein
LSVITLQAAINGYKGPAANVLAAVDGSTGLVIVSQDVPIGERTPGALLVSNDPRAPERDLLFDEEMLASAIERYFRADSMGMVELLAAVQRHTPKNTIQVVGIDASGTRYQLSPDVTNGQVAVLAIMYAASNSLAIEETADFAQEMADMFMTI